MPQLDPLPVASLLIDTKNPRFLESNAAQREALRASARYQDAKLVALAEHIVKHGLNPIEITMVMRKPGNQDRYVVLEGNRRLVALRALERPEVLDGVLPSKMVSTLRKLSEQYLKNPARYIDCYIVPNREEARPWIKLRHGRDLKGAGIEKWGSQETDRFESRSGLRLHSQILDYLEDHGHIAPAERKAVPAASFRRLIETPPVAAKAGVQLSKGKLEFTAPVPNSVKILKTIVTDLTTKTIKTGDIYTVDQRREYAKGLPSASASKKPAKAMPVTTASAPITAPTPSRVVVTQPAKPRDRLIPVGVTLNISVPRITEIVEREFRGLSLETYTNAVSVLFRVFLELSCDAYIDDISTVIVPPNIKPQDRTLSLKLNLFTEDLFNKKRLSDQEAQPVRRAAQHGSFLAPSVTTMHSYVHNRFMFPPPSDLRVAWDNLQPFIIALWSVHTEAKKPLASKKPK
jgi:hypothetical protein